MSRYVGSNPTLSAIRLYFQGFDCRLRQSEPFLFYQEIWYAVSRCLCLGRPFLLRTGRGGLHDIRKGMPSRGGKTMKLQFGNNAFCDRFDWYEWSAPEYRGAEEILRAVRKLAGTGKRLTGVRVIGAAFNMTCSALESYEHEHAVRSGAALREAGLREVRRNLVIPRAVRLCEPFVLDFEDGTSLEFHPGSDLNARISVNAVPRQCMEGLNTPNFDADRLFGQHVKGRKLQDFFIAEKKETITSYRLSGNEPDSQIHDDIEYQYVFRFSDLTELMVSTTSGGYRLSLSGAMKEFLMPYLRFRAVARPVHQPFLCHGVCGDASSFLVCGIESGQRICGRISDAVSFSMDEEVLDCYMYPFFQKWYDPSLNARDPDYEKQGFDWYGSNRYGRKTVQAMLRDMKNEVVTLREYGDSPFFRQHMAMLEKGPWLPSWLPRGDLSEREPDRERARTISFFERFSTRMEGLLRALPEDSVIEVLGP